MRWPAVLLLAGCAATLEPYAGFEHVLAPAPEFRAPVKFDRKFDWIMLKSGEWLKGEITVLRDTNFEFESEELNELTLDWDDVHEVRSRDAVTMAFEDPKSRRPRVVVGRVVIDKQRVTVDDEMTYLRSDLISLVPGEQKEKDYWSGKLTINASARSGNTNQADAGSYLRLTRRSPYSRIELLYNSTYGRVDGEDTINNHRLTVSWDVFVSKKLYATPARVEFYSDIFQNIRGRITPSAGVGYHVINKPKLEWDVEGGLGWQFTRFDSVPTGDPEKVDQGVVQLGTRIDWDITKNAELKLNYTVQLGVQSIEDSTQHLSVIAEIDLWKDFDFDVGFYWDWVGSPATLADGTTPENSDYRVTIGIGWDF
ncbi:MAG: DUF481 domain-containing protein [Planctomycetota bacterium]|jgi:putative salt-induced outer membrane protein YdiY